eukprot:PhM_4_TR18865/c0_g1_i1/m.19571/K10396/KIF5; kinesin family member 5
MSDSEDDYTSSSSITSDDDDDAPLSSIGRQRSSSVPGDVIGVRALLGRTHSMAVSHQSQVAPRIRRKAENVRVVLRVRPPNELELQEQRSREEQEGAAEGSGTAVTIAPDNRRVTLRVRSTSERKDLDYTFRYDTVFGDAAQQVNVTDAVLDPLLSDVFDGYNASVLAYGQTGSGKTYTMMGQPDIPGVIPEAIRKIFATVDAAPLTRHHKISVSCVELYLEKLQDLLDPTATPGGAAIDKRVSTFGSTARITVPPTGGGSGTAVPAGQANIELRESDAQTFVSNCVQATVANYGACMSTIDRAMRNRVVASTRQNALSSRSHAIIVITVEMKDLTNKVMRRGQMYLVDLAGSEKVSKSETEGLRLDEAKRINLSLFSLRQVVIALCTKRKKKSHHVPYRDSKLTRLLENSLGGNARSVFIITVSPSTYNAEESLSSMRFGENSSQLVTKPKKHKSQTPQEVQAMLRKVTAELDAAKSMMVALKAENDILKRGGAGNSSGALSANFAKWYHKAGLVPSSALAINMDDDGLRLSIQTNLSCPLTGELMRQPVTCQDGYTYERRAIQLHFQQHGNVSPITGKPMNAGIIIPNLSMKNITTLCVERELVLDATLFDQHKGSALMVADVLIHIFGFLTLQKVVTCIGVCRMWGYVAGHEDDWHCRIDDLKNSDNYMGKEEYIHKALLRYPPHIVYFSLYKERDLDVALKGEVIVQRKARIGLYSKGISRGFS